MREIEVEEDALDDERMSFPARMTQAFSRA